MSNREWITADRRVASVPCEIVSLTIVSDGGGVPDATIYDGFNDDGEVVCTARTVQNESRSIDCGDGLTISTGIYVDIGSNVEGVLLTWVPLE